HFEGGRQPDGADRDHTSTANSKSARETNAEVQARLATRRADALVGLLRRVDLERLGALDPGAVEARLAREPQVGPWSIGVIAAQGWGWPDHGPVGDLGLMKLAAAVHGRAATVDDTAALLAPYAPQRALAGLHLLGHPLARQRRPVRAAA
ncbi:MAG: hypothetical protein ACO3KD_09130, partial [Gaiellales bacterium]